MRRTYETIEQAVATYNDKRGMIPEAKEIENLYHEYRKNWKQFKGFGDWMLYMGL